jgi:hypothetical protein
MNQKRFWVSTLLAWDEYQVRAIAQWPFDTSQDRPGVGKLRYCRNSIQLNPGSDKK